MSPIAKDAWSKRKRIGPFRLGDPIRARWEMHTASSSCHILESLFQFHFATIYRCSHLDLLLGGDSQLFPILLLSEPPRRSMRINRVDHDDKRWDFSWPCVTCAISNALDKSNPRPSEAGTPRGPFSCHNLVHSLGAVDAGRGRMGMC